MSELMLSLVAFVVLVLMTWKNAFKMFPLPSRLLAMGLGLLVVTPLLSRITIVYFARVLSAESFGTAYFVISLVTSVVFAIALAMMVAAVFAARNQPGIADNAQS